MKKLQEFIRPYLSVVLGALLLLFYLNWLSLDGGYLALGIIAIIMSAYYISIGIIGVILGDKLGGARRVLDVVTICLFPLFMFVYFLILTINLNQYFVPTGWVVVLLGMLASLALAVVYPIAKFVENKALTRIAYLFSIVFILALLLAVLFNEVGNSIALGDINIVRFAIYVVYSSMLLSALGSKENDSPKEEPAEE